MRLRGRRPGAPRRPCAVVYCDDWTSSLDGDDTAAVTALLRDAPGWDFEVVAAGPGGQMSVRDALALPGVVLYAQPGADGDDDEAYARQKHDRKAIKRFVRNGGRYLGICMGAFLAEPGFFDLFHGGVDEYFSSPGASLTTPDPSLVPVWWRGTERRMYFQDGGYMVPKRSLPDVTVLATYSNGTIAALVAPCGQGKLGLCGPHPEAPRAWYERQGVPYPGPTTDLARDLVDTLMAP
jgi:hypothetical protein